MDSSPNNITIEIYDEKVKTERAVTLSEAWMIDDVDKMDPDSENENDSPPLAGNSHNIDMEQKAKDNKATDLSDPPTEAWMTDDVGTID